MRTPTTVWLAVFAAVATLATVVAATSGAQRVSDGATAARGDHAALGHDVIGADPRRSGFGKIVNRGR